MSLRHRIDAISRVAESLNAASEAELAERLEAFAHMQIVRKLEVWADSTLTDGERQARCAAIDQERDALKTAEDIRFESTWRMRQAGAIAGSRDLLLEKLSSLRATTTDVL